MDRLRKVISNALDEIAALFANNKKMDYVASTTFTLLDASLLPVLWRLGFTKLKLKTRAALMKYAETQFNRPSFLASLTAAERSMKQ